MAKALSRYRSRAREIILGVLAQLPPGASRKDAEKALRLASPFASVVSGYDAPWPRRCWHKERRLILAERFPLPKDGTPDVIGFTLHWWPPQGRYRLQVRCSWCNGEVRGGCLLCNAAHRRVAELVALPAFRAVRRDQGARGVLCDFLEENGIEVDR